MVVSSVPAITPSQNFLALGESNRHQVSAVIHRDVRLVIERRHDVRVVRVVVLALDGVNRDVVVANQAGGDVILGRQRVGSAKHYVGAAVAQRDRQVCRLGGDVQAGRNSHAVQWLVLDEFLANDLQHLHGLVGPVNAFLAHVGQFEVGDIARCVCGCRRHMLPFLKDSVGDLPMRFRRPGARDRKIV